MQVALNPHYATRLPELDPEAMLDPDVWVQHADEDLAATEQRRELEAFAQIKAGDVQ